MRFTNELCEQHGVNDFMDMPFMVNDVRPIRHKIIRARILQGTPPPKRNYAGVPGIMLSGFHMADAMSDAHAKHDLVEVMTLNTDGEVKRFLAHDLYPYNEEQFNRATTLSNLVTSYRDSNDKTLRSNQEYGRWCNEYDGITGGIWSMGPFVVLEAAPFIEWLRKVDPDVQINPTRICDQYHRPLETEEGDLEEEDHLFGYG